MNTPIRTLAFFLCIFFPLLASANSGHRTSLTAKQKYVLMVQEISREVMVDPQLISAIITCESGWNPRVRSPKGALGLMQLMPTTARNWGVTDPFDPYQNILAGSKHVKYLLDLLDYNVPLVIAAYHAGEARILRDGTIPNIKETQIYVKAVQDNFGKIVR